MNETKTIFTLNDPSLPEIDIRKSANAWWTSEGKLMLLIAGFKMGFPIKQACIFAGISTDQYKYFVQVHPEFSTIKHYCQTFTEIAVLTNLFKIVRDGKDAKTLMWYAERVMPKEYGKLGKRCCPKCLKEYKL